MSKKNRKSKVKKRSTSETHWKILSSPFKDFTSDQTMSMLKSLGETSQDMYQDSLQKLQDLLNKVDPVLLLSAFSFYMLRSDGIAPEAESLATQHHAELLQALILQQSSSREEFQPIVGDILETVTELINKISFSHYNKRLAKLNIEMSEEEKRKLSIIEYMRLHTQVVRNWGYPAQMRRTVINLFKPLDESIEKSIGLKVEYLVDMCFQIINLLVDQLNNHVQKIISFRRIKTANGMIHRYSKIFLREENREEENNALLVP